jgi:hypothetical protein
MERPGAHEIAQGYVSLFPRFACLIFFLVAWHGSHWVGKEKGFTIDSRVFSQVANQV